jgi:hypothetical protein
LSVALARLVDLKAALLAETRARGPAWMGGPCKKERKISARVAGARCLAARRGELGHAGLCSPLPLCDHLRCSPGACCWHP